MYQDVHGTSVRTTKKKTVKRKTLSSDHHGDKESLNVSKTTIANRKQSIIQAFMDIAEIYHAQQDNNRGNAYYEGAYRLDTLDTLPPTRKELKQYKGIGDAIADKTIEMLYTGKMHILDELQNDETLQHKLVLLRVAGVGIKTYEQLVKQNITTLKALQKAHQQNAVQLTHAQELGLQHYADLQLRIPHKEAESFNTYLQTFPIQSKQIIQFVGSYRREKPTSGDIDILLCNIPITKCITYIENKYNILSFITKGKEKASFLMVIDKKVRHIDLLTTTTDKYVCALMYFTGSKRFNIKMRLVAKQKGYVLNEHRLTCVKTKKNVMLKTEQDVFDVLEMTFVKPEHR